MSHVSGVVVRVDNVSGVGIGENITQNHAITQGEAQALSGPMMHRWTRGASVIENIPGFRHPIEGAGTGGAGTVGPLGPSVTTGPTTDPNAGMVTAINGPDGREVIGPAAAPNDIN